VKGDTAIADGRMRSSSNSDERWATALASTWVRHSWLLLIITYYLWDSFLCVRRLSFSLMAWLPSDENEHSPTLIKDLLRSGGRKVAWDFDERVCVERWHA
jgi:hypothetical protein